MNRHVIYLSLLLMAMVLGLGCSKDNTQNPSVSQIRQGPDNYPLFYDFEGFKDIIVNKNEDTTINMPIHIDFFESSIGLGLTFQNLPSGVTVAPHSLLVHNSFDTVFVFRLNIDSAATYNVTVHGESTNSGYPSLGGTNFNIVVR